MTMSTGQRRSARGEIGPHRTVTTESLPLAQGATDFKPSTYRAFWRSDTPIHRHTMHHAEANRSHKFIATGHCHPQ